MFFMSLRGQWQKHSCSDRHVRDRSACSECRSGSRESGDFLASATVSSCKSRSSKDFLEAKFVNTSPRALRALSPKPNPNPGSSTIPPRVLSPKPEGPEGTKSLKIEEPPSHFPGQDPPKLCALQQHPLQPAGRAARGPPLPPSA